MRRESKNLGDFSGKSNQKPQTLNGDLGALPAAVQTTGID